MNINPANPNATKKPVPLIVVLFAFVATFLIFMIIIFFTISYINRSTFEDYDAQLKLAKSLKKKNLLTFKNFRRRCPKCTNVMYYRVLEHV